MIQYYGNFDKEWYLLTILYFTLQSLTVYLGLFFAIGTSKMAVRTCQRIKIGSRGFPLQGCFRRANVRQKHILQRLSNTNFANVGFNHTEK
ncbi:hypothetical protein D1640_11080 [Muribaculaceae bacterium S4]|nr:hypothetical protein [Muribaculaceae bacterium S4]